MSIKIYFTRRSSNFFKSEPVRGNNIFSNCKLLLAAYLPKLLAIGSLLVAGLSGVFAQTAPSVSYSTPQTYYIN
ncbi:MAG: hypothetical protein ACOYLO_07180, partial [Ferruginibacter sp.]